jgi:hypothetical protein
LRFKVKGYFAVEGFGLRIWNLGFRVSGLGIEVQG